MGLFFQKKKKKKSSKLVYLIRIILTCIMIFLLVLGVLPDSNFSFFFGVFFMVAGIGSIVEGIESYFQKEDKNIYFIDVTMAGVYFFLSFTFLN